MDVNIYNCVSNRRLLSKKERKRVNKVLSLQPERSRKHQVPEAKREILSSLVCSATVPAYVYMYSIVDDACMVGDRLFQAEGLETGKLPDPNVDVLTFGTVLVFRNNLTVIL